MKGKYEKSVRKEIRRCLVREATSPEVTDDEDETRRVAVPLVWESTRLRLVDTSLVIKTIYSVYLVYAQG